MADFFSRKVASINIAKITESVRNICEADARIERAWIAEVDGNVHVGLATGPDYLQWLADDTSEWSNHLYSQNKAYVYFRVYNIDNLDRFVALF